MYGIAGVQYKHSVDPAVLDRALAHFGGDTEKIGPESCAVYRSACAVFVSRRRRHPGQRGDESGSCSARDSAEQGCFVDGEIRNGPALWQALALGLPLPERGIEAVLAAALARDKTHLQQFDGSFGLCFWDKQDGSLLLARDRFGSRPLYIYEDEQCIAFASRLRTLLGLQGLDHSLDPVGFQDLLAHGHGLAPRTMFARIRKLPSGCAQYFTSGQGTLVRYAEVTPREPAQARSEDEYAAELASRLTSAVQAQLAGPSPVGVLLDGSPGSSAIAACAQRTGARLMAYSVAMPDADSASAHDVARRLGLNHTVVATTHAQWCEGLDAVLRELDEPVAASACLTLAPLCQRAREDVSVVLCAAGSQELFAGHPHYRLALNAALDRDTAFAHFFLQGGRFIDANQWLRDKSLLPQHLRLRAFFDHADTLLNGMQAFEIHGRLPEQVLAGTSAVLQGCSLEARFPFLDLGVSDLASTLPQAIKLPHAGLSQHLLRRLLAERVPAVAAAPAIQDLAVPPARLLQPLRDRLLGAIETLRSHPVAEVLDLDAIVDALRRFYLGDVAVAAARVWSLAVMLLWWAEVYPLLHATRPAPTPAATLPQQRRLTVYTVLLGAKEALANPLAGLPADATTDLDIDWVCLTDNPALRSSVWRMQLMPVGHVPPEKLSRRPKALPHEYFPDTEFSLYVDNTVTFKRLPQSSDLATQQPYLFRAFRHSTRTSPSEEAAAVATIGYDDVNVICQQIDFYAKRRPLGTITPLTTATVLLRQHHQAEVRRFGTLWWETLLTFSKRDQISFDFALHEAGARLEYFDGFTDDNPFIHWNGSMSPQRVRADFDAQRYAWLHRDDPQAQRDPRAHFLARGGGSQQAYLRDSMLLEFACHMNGSSLGGHVSPRRGMANTLEALLAPRRVAACRYLLVRVQERGDNWAFDAGELDTACRALGTYLNPAQGTAIDLSAQDLQPDGKVYSVNASHYDLLILLGAGGEQLGWAVEKLMRLVDRRSGQFVAVLVTPATLQQAAEAERNLAQRLDVQVQASVHASRHDEQHGLRPNTLIAFQWPPSAAVQAVAP